LNGVQLWIALPDDARNGEPSFEHVPEEPVRTIDGADIRTFTNFPDLIGADVDVHDDTAIPLDPAFEYGVFMLDGENANTLFYLPPGSSELPVKRQRLLLLGGTPFQDPVLMWWNFVARTRAEIAAARADWQAGRRFGDVPGYKGPRIPAPALMRLAEPNPAS
jgi:redox-sensitive bicupin YhaK (pirin superfamily)